MPLFKRDKNAAPAWGKMDNCLGPTTVCHGTMKVDGNLRIDNVFEGQIDVTGSVVVTGAGQVLADITAHAVQVGGSVRGNITARDYLEILSTGHVWGDVCTQALQINAGGVLRGRSLDTHPDAESSAELSAVPTSPEAPRAVLPQAAAAPPALGDVSALAQMREAVTRAAVSITATRPGRSRPPSK